MVLVRIEVERKFEGSFSLTVQPKVSTVPGKIPSCRLQNDSDLTKICTPFGQFCHNIHSYLILFNQIEDYKMFILQ